MLRPATEAQIQQLRRTAAVGTDVELDAILTELGILPPADLEPIRTCLASGDHVDPLTNRDGHRMLSIRAGGRTIAWIHPDGVVVSPGASLRTITA